MLRASLLALCCIASTAAFAQQPSVEVQLQFLNRIFAVSNAVSPETARESHAQCVALGKELAALQGVDDLQRLYLEAEIESCISYAMNNGKFADEAGDECSHHFAFATKLAQVITQGQGKPGFAGDVMATLGERLKRATEIGPQVGCKDDYAVFAPAIAIAEANTEPPPPPADRDFIGEVGNVKYEITAENAKEMQKKCLAFRPRIAAVPELSPMEQRYVEALIEDCVARAKVSGNYSDELGDVCAHHFAFAVKLSEGIAAGATEPPHPDHLQEILKGELEIAKRQGPDMGCKQDYAGLKG